VRSSRAALFALMPTSPPRPSQFHHLWRFRKIRWRKSRRAKQRIRQRAIFRTKAQHLHLKQSDVPRLQDSFKKLDHVLNLS